MAEQHQRLVSKQDDQLDQLHSGVSRVKALAGVMRDELSDQSVILESLEDDVVKADSQMQIMNRRLRSMVENAKKSDRTLYCVIGVLTVALVFLFLAVLS